MADAFLEQNEPARLTLPAYALPRKRAMLIDGCRWLAAVAPADVPFDLTLFRVHGPVDAECQPDLRHHAEADPLAGDSPLVSHRRV